MSSDDADFGRCFTGDFDLTLQDIGSQEKIAELLARGWCFVEVGDDAQAE